MQSLSDYIKNTNIEDEVFSEIESCLNEEETIVRN